MRRQDSRAKFLDATIKVVRTKGYAATRIEDVCAEAQLTKGSFFHHFKSKEDLALAAVEHWNACAADIFAGKPLAEEIDPLARLIAYVEFRKALLTGDLPDFTCFAGTIIQEAYRTHETLRAACAASIDRGVAALQADIRLAMDKYGVPEAWTPESLALHMEAVVQGGFILAKARGDAKAAADSLEHLRRYLELLFGNGSHARTH
jgi:TetR/AcrR family transcriptional repressor of nem operon